MRIHTAKIHELCGFLITLARPPTNWLFKPSEFGWHEKPSMDDANSAPLHRLSGLLHAGVRRNLIARRSIRSGRNTSVFYAPSASVFASVKEVRKDLLHAPIDDVLRQRELGTDLGFQVRLLLSRQLIDFSDGSSSIHWHCGRRTEAAASHQMLRS